MLFHRNKYSGYLELYVKKKTKMLKIKKALEKKERVKYVKYESG